MNRKVLALAAATTVAAAITLVSGSPSQAAVPTCFGKAATIVGTNGADTLIGTNGTDVIVGLGGNDQIQGYPHTLYSDEPASTAPDYLCGGDGNDGVYGDAGRDLIHGGYGDDQINGGPGKDTLYGDAGADTIEGDYEPGSPEPGDVLYGGTGNDTLRSDGGADSLYGQGGNDQLIDGDCETASRLIGGPGSDSMKSYQDYFRGESCASMMPNVVADYIDGGTEYDHSVNDTPDKVVNVEDKTILY